ncbi:GNAT family N-acetyltransferase [Arthrobacter sp. AL12]|uniref:GNAT family N-acetyltransferase n=1 Tax=Arthrobacter sp. AL12 TaxID=3042241 RepID=UPI00249C0E91|nr:GNAT family N-acetyltransferase [Arthrobacter sp. AL12]MDI3213751.1 GNAT family N-acetyltransferase [Arthrobacter sp. AL12]
MNEALRLQRHEDLGMMELAAMQKLFDSEYLSDFGRWNPHAPYGYSPADFHVLAFQGSVLAAHVGFQRRVISVGADEVLVAGTGGVLVDPRFRGTGLGGRAMRHAQKAMRDEAEAHFGFLGCRNEVVPFYESAGWVQVHATERCLSRADQKSVIVSQGGPTLICSSSRDASEWPNGDIDLRGTPW